MVKGRKQNIKSLMHWEQQQFLLSPKSPDNRNERQGQRSRKAVGEPYEARIQYQFKLQAAGAETAEPTTPPAEANSRLGSEHQSNPNIPFSIPPAQAHLGDRQMILPNKRKTAVALSV